MVDHPDRLDRFLRKQFPFLSRQTTKLWLQQKAILVNQNVGKPGTRLAIGDIVQVRAGTPLPQRYPLPWDEAPWEQQNNLLLGTQSFNHRNLETKTPDHRNLEDQGKRIQRIAYLGEEKGILAVNKPSGWVCHPYHFWERESVVQAVLARYPSLRGIGEDRAPGLLHRLDNETSGVLLFATSHQAFTHYHNQLQQGRWNKIYLAQVHGTLPSSLTITDSIAHTPGKNESMSLVRDLKHIPKIQQHAITHIRPLASNTESTLCQVQIETGVRHQIRLHLASLGHPIVGDRLYGSDAPSPFRLHAYQVTLPAFGGNQHELSPSLSFEANPPSSWTYNLFPEAFGFS